VANGYKANATVAVLFGTSRTRIAELTADANGVVKGDVKIPADATPGGVYPVTTSGTGASGSALEITANLNVTAAVTTTVSTTTTSIAPAPLPTPTPADPHYTG
jgi:uncharacterized membrane protein